MSRAIDRPVFILGTGRSGTTLFFNTLALHPQLAWFSNYTHRLPGHPSLALLARVRDLPFSDRWLTPRLRFVPRPIETYEMLNYCTDSMFTSKRMLSADDVTEDTRKRYHRIVRSVLRFQGKQRFVQKHTGFARIRYLREIFPDALFIHVYRDGRAVAHSMNRVDWWPGDLSGWKWGDMKPVYMQEYEDSGRESIVLAAIVWKTLMELIEEECAELLPSQLLRVRYDAMIHDLAGTMDEVMRFCDLTPSPRFERHVGNTQVMDMDLRWTRDLSAHQKELLEQTLASALVKHGF